MIIHQVCSCESLLQPIRHPWRYSVPVVCHLMREMLEKVGQL